MGGYWKEVLVTVLEDRAASQRDLGMLNEWTNRNKALHSSVW